MAKKAMATFIPEAWTPDDCAGEIAGRRQFDVTDQIVAMGKEKALSLRDRSDSSDQLAENAGMVGVNAHDGPFSVECEDAIREFYET